MKALCATTLKKIASFTPSQAGPDVQNSLFSISGNRLQPARRMAV